MARSIRKIAITAAIEATYGTDAAPTGAANGMLISNLTVNPLNAKSVDRNVMRPYMGGSEQLVGVSYKEISFDVELVGSGTAGVAPPWGPLLRACGFAEVITATTRVDYTPISDLFESLTIYYYRNGVLHKALGCRGNVSIKLQQGEKPLMSFKFQGLHPSAGTIAAASVTATTLAAFRVPQVVTDLNSGDLTFGATHATATAPALAGGTINLSGGLTFDLGNKIGHRPLLGGESIEIGDRNVTGSIKLDLNAAQEVSFYNTVMANGLTSLGLRHGTNVGDRVLIFMPAVQLTDPAEEEMESTMMNGYKIGAKPLLGNDEVRIVTSF